MEVAIIDWKTIDSRFIKDDLYEHIHAPQWIDFSASDDPVNDEAWFCRPDCNHPKTVEDFFKNSPTTSEKKLQKSASVSEIIPFGDRNRRDATLKKRGLTQPSNPYSKCDRFVDDSENQNPAFSTPLKQKVSKFMKEAVKTSTEKKQVDSYSQKEATPRLRSTLSARNLFAGRDILNQITEFCNELKRLAMRAKDRENVEKENANSPMVVKKQEMKESSRGNLSELDERERERKPLLEVSKDKCEAMERSNLKDKQRRKKRTDEAENIHISVNLKNIKSKGKESLLQIRTNPPSPQCFTANRGATKPTPPKALRSRPPERGILQELEQSKKETVRKEQTDDNNNEQKSFSGGVAEREARALGVFWFLKPCTLSS